MVIDNNIYETQHFTHCYVAIPSFPVLHIVVSTGGNEGKTCERTSDIRGKQQIVFVCFLLRSSIYVTYILMHSHAV